MSLREPHLRRPFGAPDKSGAGHGAVALALPKLGGNSATTDKHHIKAVDRYLGNDRIELELLWAELMELASRASKRLYLFIWSNPKSQQVGNGVLPPSLVARTASQPCPARERIGRARSASFCRNS